MTRRHERRLHSFGAPEEAPAPDEARAPLEAGTLEAANGPAARSVSEVVAAVGRALAADPGLQGCWIRGEVSGFKAASSGHWYFDLKDENALLNAVMFRGANGRVRFEPENGMDVLVRGRISVYSARSNVQVLVEEMRPVGQGELALRFEQLRRRLEAEGLFSLERKRPLPPHPKRVGIVTSLAAAALRDLVRVATQRHPGIQLLVANARVQGEGAAAEIARALQRLDAHGACDVIIVGRGGGSMEDLWAFNEEAVVRAVAACRTPVVSAVGHETDFTLCDLAADHRAATPSNAAETVVPDVEALLDSLDDMDQRMLDAWDRLLAELNQRLDDLAHRAGEAARRACAKEAELLAVQAARLQALSPLATLARGYAVARAEGRLVRSVDAAPPGTPLEVVLQDGTLDTTVTRRRRSEHDQEDAG